MNMSSEEVAADIASRKTEEKKQKMNYRTEEDDYWNEFDSDLTAKTNDTKKIRYITKNSLEDNPKIRNHIIVCGINQNLYHFILPLRAKYLKDVQPIVILSTAEIPSQFLKKIGMHDKTYRIVGSPLNPEDLKRANLNSAAKVVIVASDSLSNCKTPPDELLDAEMIFVYKTVKLMNPDIQVILELAKPSNIKYLESKGRDYEGDYDFSPVFAAGDVYTYSMIDTLTAQAYFNPHIVTICQQLLRGSDSKSILTRSAKELKQSRLLQIPVPEEFINKQFRELFLYLLDNFSLIALGIYRLPWAMDNKYPYVYTNPNPECRLSHKDMIFVLGRKFPELSLNKSIALPNFSQKKNKMKINIIPEENGKPQEERKESRVTKPDLNEKIETAAGKIAKNISNKVEEIRKIILQLNEEMESENDRIKNVIDSIFESAKKDEMIDNDII